MTETSGEALPDLWYVTHIVNHYQGREFIVQGTGTFTGTFDHFHRYATPVDGEAALERGTM